MGVALLYSLTNTNTLTYSLYERIEKEKGYKRYGRVLVLVRGSGRAGTGIGRPATMALLTFPNLSVRRLRALMMRLPFGGYEAHTKPSNGS